MLHLMFSVYDVKAEVFQRTFAAGAKGEAIRSFIDICNDKEHPLGQHPGDYSLIEVGTWDDKSGEVVNIVNVPVLTGVEAAAAGSEG